MTMFDVCKVYKVRSLSPNLNIAGRRGLFVLHDMSKAVSMTCR